MTRRRIEPIVWLLFSAGGALTAMFLPVLMLLFGLAIPLGWVSRPDRDHLLAVTSHPATLLFLMVLFILALVHSAHRFRYTLYDGLQLKQLKGPIAVLCYGTAVLGSVASALVLWTLA
jgi:succinate dehydrogenase subunit D